MKRRIFLVCLFYCFFRLPIYESIAAIFWQSASYVSFFVRSSRCANELLKLNVIKFDMPLGILRTKVDIFLVEKLTHFSIDISCSYFVNCFCKNCPAHFLLMPGLNDPFTPVWELSLLLLLLKCKIKVCNLSSPSPLSLMDIKLLRTQTHVLLFIS